IEFDAISLEAFYNAIEIRAFKVDYRFVPGCHRFVVMNRKRSLAIGTDKSRVLWKAQNNWNQAKLLVELDRPCYIGRRHRDLIELHQIILSSLRHPSFK